MKRTALGLAVAACALLAGAADATAQLLPRFSVNGGIAVPIRNEADFFKSGIHAGVGLKLPIVPIQFEAAFDRMSADTDAGDDLTILSAGAVAPISLTPALLPVGIYVLAGGGLYRVDATETSTKFGITGGAGVRLGLPMLAPFVEGRGVMIFSEGNKVTYLTAAVGIRL